MVQFAHHGSYLPVDELLDRVEDGVLLRGQLAVYVVLRISSGDGCLSWVR
jgi:hypothetical protein